MKIGRIKDEEKAVTKIRKYGDFFEELTGKKASDCESILEVEKEVEKKLKRRLQLKSFSSNIIPRHGSILPLSENNLEAIDRELDSLLKKVI